jgi:4-amino-4-deoxychorismate lyase
LARANGLRVTEERITVPEMLGADELFLTNSVIGLWPIQRIGDRIFPVQRSGAFARDLDCYIHTEGQS